MQTTKSNRSNRKPAGQSANVDAGRFNGAAEIKTESLEVSGNIAATERESAKSAVPMAAAAVVAAALESLKSGNGIVIESAAHPRITALQSGAAVNPVVDPLPVQRLTSAGAVVVSTKDLFLQTYSTVLAALKSAGKTEKDAFNSFKVFSDAKWFEPAADADARKYRQGCWVDFKAAMREAMGIEVSIGGKTALVQRVSNPRVVWDSRTGMPKRWSQSLTIGGDIPESAIAEHVDSLKKAHAAVQALIGA